jgi:CheY-like chemotaxis protein
MDPLKILQLEDMEFDVELIQRAVKNEFPNAEFSVVDNKRDFIQALDTFQPNLILSDNNLPAYDAASAMVHLKSCNCDIPMIVVSGTITDDMAQEIIDQGIFAFILKDDMEELPSIIERAIARG